AWRRRRRRWRRQGWSTAPEPRCERTAPGYRIRLLGPARLRLAGGMALARGRPGSGRRTPRAGWRHAPGAQHRAAGGLRDRVDLTRRAAGRNPAARGRRVTPSSAPQGLVLPALQLGISLALLVAAGQLGRVAGAGAGAAPGLQTDALVYDVMAPEPPALRAARYASLLRRLAAERAFDAVSLTSAGASA